MGNDFPNVTMYHASIILSNWANVYLRYYYGLCDLRIPTEVLT